MRKVRAENPKKGTAQRGAAGGYNLTKTGGQRASKKGRGGGTRDERRGRTVEATTCSLSPFLPTLESIIRRLFHLLSERRSAGIVALNVHNMTGHGHWTIETGIPRRPMKIRQASKQGTPFPSWYLRGIMSDFVRLKSFKFHHPTSYHQGANRSRVWARGVHVAWVDKECNFTAAAMAAIHF